VKGFSAFQFFIKFRLDDVQWKDNCFFRLASSSFRLNPSVSLINFKQTHQIFDFISLFGKRFWAGLEICDGEIVVFSKERSSILRMANSHASTNQIIENADYLRSR